MGTYVKRKKTRRGTYVTRGGNEDNEEKKPKKNDQASPNAAAQQPCGPIRNSRFEGLQDLIPALEPEEVEAPEEEIHENTGLRGVVQQVPRSLLDAVRAGGTRQTSGESRSSDNSRIVAVQEGVHLARSDQGWLILINRKLADRDRLNLFHTAWSPTTVYVQQKNGRPFPSDQAAQEALQQIFGK